MLDLKRFCISNIAWDLSREDRAAEILKQNGISHVEVAPTKIWPDLNKANLEEAIAYKKFWQDRGFAISALQSLLFGRPDLQIFASPEDRLKTLNYLKKAIQVAEWLGAKVLIFGSPKNRKRNGLDQEKALEIAGAFFQEVGEYASNKGLFFCLEPNAKKYDCDFINTSDEGSSLVKRVNSKGFGLHLDLACMEMEGEDLSIQLPRYAKLIKHFHISSPQLEPIGKIHDRATNSVRYLNENGYQGLFSVEMKTLLSIENLNEIF